MRHAGKQLSPRPAFTLVELMVSLALIMFIMAILSQAFVTGMDTFRDMKGIGDMEERLRSATQILRRDLAADHFEGRRRLSDVNFWNAPVREGFFHIKQGTFRSPTGPNAWNEGSDADGNTSGRATDHVLHFTSKLRGNSRESVFAATVLANSPVFGAGTFVGQSPIFQDPMPTPLPQTWTYHSPWAEIAYVLKPTGVLAGSTPLGALYRFQRVMVPNNTKLNWPSPAPAAWYIGHVEMACLRNPPGFNGLYFVTPNSVAGDVYTTPIRSVDLTTKDGESLLLTDVISFDVRVMKYVFPTPTNAGGLDSDFFDLPGAAEPMSFDTYVAQPGSPPGYLIKALQISIRVWDSKTQQTRQVTIVQDM